MKQRLCATVQQCCHFCGPRTKENMCFCNTITFTENKHATLSFINYDAFASVPSRPPPSIPGFSTSCGKGRMNTNRRCSSALRSVNSGTSARSSPEFRRETLEQRWLMILACLNDNVFYVNSFNKSLQGRFTAVIGFVDKIQAFIVKLVGQQHQIKTFQHV